jgi:hypothetical protein
MVYGSARAAEGLAAVFSAKSAASETAKAVEADLEKLLAKIGRLGLERHFFGERLRSISAERRRQQVVNPANPWLSLVWPSPMLPINRSGFHHRRAVETPWYGSGQMARHLRRGSDMVGRERIRRPMARMGLTPNHQQPRTTLPHRGHRIWRYPPRILR